MSKKLVAVAVSGGVDSSTAALLLKKQGYEVLGLHMHLWRDESKIRSESTQNSTLETSIDKAEQACRSLGIPLNVVDLKKDFKKYVVDYFCQGYLQGLTPNPCVMCNKYLKFGQLLEKALSLGAEYLATGHYARIEHFDQAFHLVKGTDSSKDQSYVLYNLKQDALRCVCFPLGNYRKIDVRKIAKENNLPAAEVQESQDICFIDGKYGDFLSCHTKSSLPGEIVSTRGEVLGTHKGIIYYTIGQRHGLGISASSPFFVTSLDSVNNRVVVGTEQELYSPQLTARNVNWLSGGPVKEPTEVTIKIRYKSPEMAATLYPGVDKVKIRFHQPLRAITPGQSVVFYKGDEVVGGGIIEKES